MSHISNSKCVCELVKSDPRFLYACIVQYRLMLELKIKSEYEDDLEWMNFYSQLLGGIYAAVSFLLMLVLWLKPIHYICIGATWILSVFAFCIFIQSRDDNERVPVQFGHTVDTALYAQMTGIKPAGLYDYPNAVTKVIHCNRADDLVQQNIGNTILPILLSKLWITEAAVGLCLANHTSEPDRVLQMASNSFLWIIKAFRLKNETGIGFRLRRRTEWSSVQRHLYEFFIRGCQNINETHGETCTGFLC